MELKQCVEQFFKHKNGIVQELNAWNANNHEKLSTKKLSTKQVSNPFLNPFLKQILNNALIIDYNNKKWFVFITNTDQLTSQFLNNLKQVLQALQATLQALKIKMQQQEICIATQCSKELIPEIIKQWQLLCNENITLMFFNLEKHYHWILKPRLVNKIISLTEQTLAQSKIEKTLEKALTTMYKQNCEGIEV